MGKGEGEVGGKKGGWSKRKVKKESMKGGRKEDGGF